MTLEPGPIQEKGRGRLVLDGSTPDFRGQEPEHGDEPSPPRRRGLLESALPAGPLARFMIALPCPIVTLQNTMLGSLLTKLSAFEYLWSSPFALLLAAFQIWMFIHAVRQREWIWALFILVGFGFAALWYYFSVYRASPSSLRGFELPGAQNRRRIKELQAQIHHLDKAHHHYQLGDVYFRQGKLEKAEECYRASVEREPQDIDTRAHLGQCLLRQRKLPEARSLLEGVVAENPKHDYGYSQVALAETLAALGETECALKLWQHITQNHSYPRAKVQLAELYISKGQTDLARHELTEVLADDAHAPSFQRKRDRIWVRMARGLMRRLP
jgi:tetratricopeptide (TPR) repeat protein